MTTITLNDALYRLREEAGLRALPNFVSGLYREGTADPDNNTPTDTPFFINTSSGAVFYLSSDRSTWFEVVDASLLSAGQEILTATPPP
jgi:hypothetical protein